MATQSKAPPNPTVEDSQKPELVQPTNEDQQDANAEVTKITSGPSPFVNTEPMREDQVQNAVKFLSHPKVRNSPIIHRRSFLERKGLTKEEIDEAFHRVPDPPPTVSTVQASTNQDGQVKSSSNVQAQPPQQTLQSAAAAPGVVVSTMGNLTRSRFHWSHALFVVGFLAASGAGTAVLFKNAIVPRLKSWIRKVVLEEESDSAKKINSKPSLAEEATAAAKAAAAAAADVAKANQEMLNLKNDEKRCLEEMMKLIDVQVYEMKSMSNAIQKLEGQQSNASRINVVEQDHRVSVTSSTQPNGYGRADFDFRSVRSSSPPASVELTVAPHPKSYMEIMTMVQRGEKPPNIKDINDLPPNPNQPLPNPRIAPRSKPWEAGQTQNSSSHVLQTQVSRAGLSFKELDNGLKHEPNGDSSVPWWQQKNVRITELESEDGLKTESYGMSTNERPIQRAWVPPQPPPIAMPEAADAIRQPKSSGHPSEPDELQRITRISESGGEGVNGGSSEPKLSEIQEEETSQ